MLKTLVPLAVLAVLAPAAQGASFDCSKASAPVEKAICADKDLSAADSELAATYNAALAKVSEQGRAILREGQRQWLSYTRSQCLDQKRASDPQPLAACLKSSYDSRQSALKDAVFTKGGLTFVRAESYKARKEKREPDDQWPTTGWETLEVAYPQIDAAKSPSDIGFNKHFVERAKHDADAFKERGTDYWYSYDSVTVTATLISVETVASMYGHGAAHPLSNTEIDHWLRTESRPLQATDVFAKDSGWAKFVNDFCFRKVKRESFAEKPEQIKDITKDPGRWMFDSKGLTVLFNQYEVASYAEGIQYATIPWSELKPYLAKNAPVGPAK